MEEIKNQDFIVHLSLGTNKGDRLSNLRNAVQLISEKIGEINAISTIYENPPVGFIDETQFYNICLSVKTKLSPRDILFHSQSIEKELGRTTKSSNGIFTARIIDIDVILYENKIINIENLTIPHPLFTFRRFVLVPLNEIAPNNIDPVSQQSISSLLEKCTDNNSLKAIEETVFKK